jgi:hypothetical protein
LHVGHRFSPVPGVPGAASSPGAKSMLSGMPPPCDDGQHNQLHWSSKPHSTGTFSCLPRLATGCFTRGLLALSSVPWQPFVR